MSDVIKLLPESVANQIAAGEVVQRPASVVKELLENAIDAGAGQIKLVIKDAGKTLIQVIDNGCGMSETDARMAFERHATSKIRDAKDLFGLQTMGFRGEALASIAAVAQVELQTRRTMDEVGCKILIEDSKIRSQEPVAAPVGTMFSVKNLFFNVPARRQFLKADSVEMRHILEEFEHVALAHPDVFFSLHHNGQEIYRLAAGNLRQRVLGVFGQNLNKNLVPINEETDALRISGFISKPDHVKKTRGEQFFFVNHRYIKSGYLHSAVMAAYEGLVNDEAFPLYTIFLEIDPARIDVNVHPTKQEIKFDDEKLIFNMLKVAARHALASNALVPMMDFDPEVSFSKVAANATSNAPKTNSEDEFSEKSSGAGGLTVEDFIEKKGLENQHRKSGQSFGLGKGARLGSEQNHPDHPTQLNARNLKNWEVLYQNLDFLGQKGLENESEEPQDVESLLAAQPAESLEFLAAMDDEGEAETPTFTIENRSWAADPAQLDDTAGSFSKASKEPYQIHGQYVVSQIKSGFLLIDQTAASERILFEKYMAALIEQPISTQAALFPKTIQLSYSDAVLLREILPDLNKIGFDMAEFGRDAFVLHGVPADLIAGQDEQKLIEKLLGQIKMGHDMTTGSHEAIARSMARSAAVRRGQMLTPSEMTQLIDQLFACDAPFSSPSGKPTFVQYDLDDIKKRFA